MHGPAHVCAVVRAIVDSSARRVPGCALQRCVVALKKSTTLRSGSSLFTGRLRSTCIRSVEGVWPILLRSQHAVPLAWASSFGVASFFSPHTPPLVQKCGDTVVVLDEGSGQRSGGAGGDESVASCYILKRGAFLFLKSWKKHTSERCGWLPAVVVKA